MSQALQNLPNRPAAGPRRFGSKFSPMVGLEDISSLQRRSQIYLHDSSIAVFSEVSAGDFLLSLPELDQPAMSSAAVWSIVKAQFDEIGRLKYNWDHRRSAAVPQGTLAFTFQMLTSIMPPPPAARAPAVVPLGSGEIQLVWRSAVGELEIEVERPNQVQAFFLDYRTGKGQEWEISTNFKPLSDILWKMNRV